jgi:primase-polymerase (primpol)-like protein
MSDAATPPRIKYAPLRLKALRTAFGAMCGVPIFTYWRWVLRGDKWQKVPTHHAGKMGVSLDDALAAYKMDETIAGVGVKFGQVGDTSHVLFGVDYDGADKGPLPQEWPACETYAERSPSGGDRFHVIGLYQGEPLEGRRKGAVEIYPAGRFFTLTGDHIKGQAKVLPVDVLPYYKAIGVDDPQPYGAAAAASVKGSPTAEADLSEREREFLDAVRGIEDADASKQDFMVCAELYALGATDQEAARVLCAGFWRTKLGRADYLGRTLAKAREAAEADAQEQEGGATDQEEEKAFHDDSVKIGEGGGESDDNNPRIYKSVEEMLADAVYIREGSQVALRADPRHAWSFSEFENDTAASKLRTQQKGRPAGIAKLWLAHSARQTVSTRTFKAGGPLFCQSPNDMTAINTWREPPRDTPPGDWRDRSRPFRDHVEFLIPVQQDRETFLDWLAHVEQQPGVLPHFHFLLYTPRHGVGRNWLSYVLARVWAGVTALDVDLRALLDGKFNGRLSRKVFAVVNEIREGGSTSYSNAERLKGLFTDETRRINPKYGREYDEFNAVRWLMFSNHEAALPLDRFDRRVYAIANPEKPREPAYYAKLYAAAADAEFIASVREELRTRDLSRFNPGMHAPLTEAKERVIEASMSDAELEMKDVVADHPADCITADALGTRLFGVSSSQKERASLRYVAARAGAQKYGGRVRHEGMQHRVWVLRNHAHWMAATSHQVAGEIGRKPGNKEAKRARKKY